MSEDVTKAVALRTPELDLYARLGQWLAASEVESPNELQKGATAALRMYFAEALGLSPLAASELSVIRGNLVVSAKLIRALAAKGGYRVVPVEGGDGKSCTARLLERDSGEAIGERTFTIEMAEARGLVRPNSNWTRIPERMLWARASKNVVDDFAAEVSMGLVLDDEVQEITGEVWEEPAPEPEPKPEPSEAETFVAPKGKRGEGGQTEAA